MARASTPTLLALDRWAAIVGLDPRHFNQVTIANLAPTRNCKQIWTQYAWQSIDSIGREEVAQAIQRAESDIITALGFYPVPQWVNGEVVLTPRDYDRYSLGCSNLAQPAGRFVSVQAAFGQLISGGLETRNLIASPAIGAGQWSDPDGDGYDDICTLVVATTVTDVNEIRVYFPGHNGEEEWEIRPLRSVAIAGGNATIVIDRHLLVDPDLWEALQPGEVDGLVDANFVTSVDVYRVWNDPSQQAQLQWERMPNECDCGSTSCASCAWATQWACLQARNPRLGIFTYQPADWDAIGEFYSLAALAASRRPERVRLYYRSGYQSSKVKRPMVEMDPTFEQMIVRYSICLLDRPICSCSNVEGFRQLWTEDRALVGQLPDAGRYQMRPEDLACPWGTQKGAIDAWRQAERMKISRGVNY